MGLLTPGRILIVAPPPLVPTDDAHINAIFTDGIEKSQALATHYQRIANNLNCDFWDAGTAAQASPLDGLHLDEQAHASLARGLIARVQQSLA